MTNENKKPLYKVLNEQRTQGSWNEDGRGIVGDQPHIEICVMTDDDEIEDAYANAQYTALAVNNLHIVASKLTKSLSWMNCLMSDIESGNVQYDENYVSELKSDIEETKEALKNIS